MKNQIDIFLNGCTTTSAPIQPISIILSSHQLNNPVRIIFDPVECLIRADTEICQLDKTFANYFSPPGGHWDCSTVLAYILCRNMMFVYGVIIYNFDRTFNFQFLPVQRWLVKGKWFLNETRFELLCIADRRMTTIY